MHAQKLAEIDFKVCLESIWPDLFLRKKKKAQLQLQQDLRSKVKTQVLPAESESLLVWKLSFLPCSSRPGSLQLLMGFPYTTERNEL